MKLIHLSIQRRVTIAMFTLAVVLFGAVSFVRLKINLLPDLTYPTLTIRTEYPGAAPAEIENLISKPIEETIGIVKNVKTVSSISRTGQSDVLLEFEWGTNMDYAGMDVREKLDALELPLEIRRPTLLRFDPSLDPILRYGFYLEVQQDSTGTDILSENQMEEQLKIIRRFAEEEIKKELEAGVGVAAVKISGGLEDEIQVLIDQQRTAQLNLSIEQIVGQLQAENVNLSGGRLEEGTHQYLVRTLNQFESVEEIGEVVISTNAEKPLKLKDVAIVQHGYKEREAITRLGGKEAVEIAIYKEGDANTVAVGKSVEGRINRVRKMLPEGLKLTKVYDQSTFITQSVDEVIQAGIWGGILAVIVLYFFLRNIWATLIISLSIPISVIATFNLMFGADLSLNIMSLGGIALGIGMLLDNSIVVLENIARHKDMGKNNYDSAKDGASEVGTAVMASTLTTIAVFLPLVFVKGIAGQLFRDQALTVTFALLASLFVALTLIPMLASLQEDKSSEGTQDKEKKVAKSKIGRFSQRVTRFIFISVPVAVLKGLLFVVRMISKGLGFIIRPLVAGFNVVYSWVEERYPKTIAWALSNRVKVILASLSLFIVSLFIASTLGIELIPQLSQGEFQIEFKLPPGTPLERTDEVIHQVQEIASESDYIETVFCVAGTGNRMDANPDQGGENWGEMNIKLVPGAKRQGEDAVMTQLRKPLERLPDVQYKFGRPTLFTFKTPVEVEISGYDLQSLKKVSQDIVNKMSSLPNFADVKSTMQSGHPEIQIHFDRDRAAALGMPVYQLADRVVSKVRGDIATKYSWRDRKVDVLVRVQEKDRNSVEKISQLIVNPQSERPIPLESVADIIIDTGPGEIRRIDQERVALVTANLKSGDLGQAAIEIQNILQQTHIPSGLNVRLTGQNEEMQVSFQSLRMALLLAVFLVYLVMASQFESFLHPFVILFTIPLALIGAVLALWMTGSTISVVVFIGMILLAGIVVNNAIVLIDLINQLRAQGMPKTEAILEGGRSRLRPILMTTLTTTLGLLPLAFGIGEGAEVRAPMAITVIGGLTIATLLTLIVIPVVYSFMDRKN